MAFSRTSLPYPEPQALALVAGLGLQKVWLGKAGFGHV